MGAQHIYTECICYDENTDMVVLTNSELQPVGHQCENYKDIISYSGYEAMIDEHFSHIKGMATYHTGKIQVYLNI